MEPPKRGLYLREQWRAHCCPPSISRLHRCCPDSVHKLLSNWEAEPDLPESGRPGFPCSATWEILPELTLYSDRIQPHRTCHSRSQSKLASLQTASQPSQPTRPLEALPHYEHRSAE